ncbi:hypothetical protein ISF_07228 [Cordyceps fumosorosea ARSEF 2679]|uniref:Uncharacterized protein n=1 Tax=Cordyceps fumosorosea (strain ARSEF 2679) TaxID=1081104 RepID=A0A167Q5B1_CORFA|nr:hypothetical protein ISF_07228 [Cordyceps fumosorosea ARSEF 2679]OAA57307.1 hypothetical protein ISF_07228 [Cordyceps fumosorosea ARSEF 2679]
MNRSSRSVSRHPPPPRYYRRDSTRSRSRSRSRRRSRERKSGSGSSGGAGLSKSTAGVAIAGIGIAALVAHKIWKGDGHSDNSRRRDRDGERRGRDGEGRDDCGRRGTRRRDEEEEERPCRSLQQAAGWAGEDPRGSRDAGRRQDQRPTDGRALRQAEDRGGPATTTRLARGPNKKLGARSGRA